MSLVPVLLGVLAATADSTVSDTAFQRWAAVPAVAYSGETGWQLGGLGILFLRPTGPDDPGSETDLAGIWTTKGQYRVVLAPDLAFLGGAIGWKSNYEFRHWPGEYWAGGNDPTDSSLRYDMDQWRMGGIVRWRAVRGVRIGVEYELERNETAFHAPDSESFARRPGAFPDRAPGRWGGDRVGLGWNVEWDGRDHDNWPRSGTYAELKQVIHPKALGSDWSYAVQSFDVRGYLPTPLRGALACAVFWEGATGDVPFDQLAMPDGTRRLRGLVKGRLADRQQADVQLEWRFPLFWRFGATVFADAGKVGNDASELAENRFRWAFGAGGRMALNPSRKVNIRGDLAWVDDGIGMTIYFKEAF